MRCFVVGCLGDGGGGCKASIDGVDVVSVDKERKEVKADTIRWRGVYMAGDNMLKDIFKDNDGRLGMQSRPAMFRSGSGDYRLSTWNSILDYIWMFAQSSRHLPFSCCISKALRPQSTFAPVPHPVHRRKGRAYPTRALGGER